MNITVPAGANLYRLYKLAESYDLRWTEWNKGRRAYQVAIAGTLPGQTWMEAVSFYAFSNL